MNPYINQQQTNNYSMQYIQGPVTVVHGRAGIDALRFAPNSGVIAMDDTAPMVWLCVADNIGRVTVKPYDISDHKEPEPVDLNVLFEKVLSFESELKNLEAKIDEQSNVRNARQTNAKSSELSKS